MRVSYEVVIIVFAVVALLGQVGAVFIRQLSGPSLKPFIVDGMSIQCLSDTRGIRVVCNDQVVFATGRRLDIFRASRTILNEKSVAVRYLGLFPRLRIVIGGQRLTNWPFSRAEWWLRFFAGGWSFVCAFGIFATILARAYHLLAVR